MINLPPLEDIEAKAASIRAQGYNCAQTVLMTFAPYLGLDEAMAAKLTAGLGSGAGASGELCGVANAMAIIAGLPGGAEAQDKAEANKKAAELLREFKNENGALRCADLKGQPGVKPCNLLIAGGIRQAYNFLDSLRK